LAVYSRTAQSSAALIAMTGRPVGLDSVDRAAAFEVFLTMAVVVALMSIFLVVRHTRADEEAGRAELVRATRVGRHAPLLAAVALLVLANLGVAVAVAVVAVVAGLGVAGAVLLGASLAGVGLVHGALAAVAAQLTAHARSALALAGSLVGLSVLLRAAGDVRDDALSWLSPIGWGQATYPYHLDRWWPLLLCLGTAGVAVGVALALLDRRDHGAGMLPGRPGRPHAPRSLGGPLGLAWRLQRGTVAGWTAGIVVSGLAFGSLVRATEDLLEGPPTRPRTCRSTPSASPRASSRWW
jgi:ABC-2 type transport system permease protein